MEIIDFCNSSAELGTFGHHEHWFPPAAFSTYIVLKSQASSFLELVNPEAENRRKSQRFIQLALLKGRDLCRFGHSLIKPELLPFGDTSVYPTSYYLRAAEKDQQERKPEFFTGLYFVLCLDELLAFRDDVLATFETRNYVGTGWVESETHLLVNSALNSLLAAQSSAEYGRASLLDAVHQGNIDTDAAARAENLAQERISGAARAAASKPRPTSFTDLMTQVVREFPDITTSELIDKFEQGYGAEIIELFDRQETHISTRNGPQHYDEDGNDLRTIKPYKLTGLKD